MSSPIREKKRKVFWRSLQVFSKRPAAQRSTMFMGTRNCPGNLTKSPGEEVEGGGGEGGKITWARIPLSHSRGGGVYTRSLKATRTKVSSGSTVIALQGGWSSKWIRLYNDMCSYWSLGATSIKRKITIKSFSGKWDLTTKLSVKKRDVFLLKKEKKKRED